MELNPDKTNLLIIPSPFDGGGRGWGWMRPDDVPLTSILSL